MKQSAASPLLVLLPILAALACTPGPDEPPAQLRKALPAKPIAEEHVDIDGDNLLNIARGASVVSRTAEFDLESSALHAIDGMSNTAWVSPNNWASHTLVFSLGAPARIDRLGVTTSVREDQRPNIRFDASMDGKTWREVFAVRPIVQREPQISAVPPFEARYLRVETIAPGMRSMRVGSVHALGRETAAPAVQSFDGCWTINNNPSRIEQDGARIRGAIGGEHPTYIDGVIEGRVARVMWTRGFMWGYAVLTLAADGRILSAMTFHENPRTGQVGQAWFGERCATNEADRRSADRPTGGRRSDRDDEASRNEASQRNGTPTSGRLRIAPPPLFLERAHHWSIEDASAPDVATLVNANRSLRFRITGYEFREATPEANQLRLAARLTSLRDALQRSGTDLSRVELVPAAKPLDDMELHFAVQKILWSRLDLTILQ